jgi:hypothetical protein
MKQLTTRPVAFGAWAPDLSPLQAPAECRNALPVAKSYEPARDLLVYSSALSERCRGLFATTNYAAVPQGFAGDRTKLYKMDAAHGVAWADVKKSGGYSLGADDRWEFAKFDSAGVVIAAAISENPQKFSISASPDSAFADLGGTPPKARHLAVWEDRVILGYLDEGGTIYHNKVKWCGTGDETDWSIDPTGSGADEQVIFDAVGEVRRVVPTEGAWLVFCDRSIHRFDWIGGDYVFENRRITNRFGSPCSGSVLEVGGLVFFLDRSGFQVLSGNQPIAVGHAKVDRYFLRQSAQLSRLDRLCAVHDPERKLVLWFYVSKENNASDPVPDRVIAYNYAEQRWGEIRLAAPVDFAADFITQQVSLEGVGLLYPVIEEATPIFDDAFWQGGQTRFAVVNGQHKLCYDEGTDLAVTLDTQEVEHFKGHLAKTKQVRPVVEGGDVQVAVASRNDTGAAVAYGAAGEKLAKGQIPFHGVPEAIGRYQRYRVTSEQGAGITKLHGLDADVVPMGRI